MGIGVLGNQSKVFRSSMLYYFDMEDDRVPGMQCSQGRV